MKKETLPPHNLEAEQAILSACLIDNANFEYCIDLSPSEFYDLRNQAVFKAMLKLFMVKRPVELISVAQTLKESKEFEQVGGAGYLSHIADAAPFVVNCESYVSIVSDMAIKRRAMRIGSMLYEKAMNDKNVSEIIDFAQSEAMQLQQSKRGDAIYDIENLAVQEINSIINTVRTERERNLLLGFPMLDKVLNISGAKLIIIAGRPAMGKTAFALTCMRNLSRLGVQSGFLSIEMGKDEILKRWFSMETGINSMKFYQYQGLSETEIERLTLVAESMREWKIQIDDTGSVGIEDVERKCRKMKKAGAQVLFIDQLSKIRGKSGDQFKDYTINCNRIADLKKELETPIFLLSQLNRELEKRADKRPTLADLKNTGSLEEDADSVIFLYRPEYYEKNEVKKAEMKQLAEVNVAKNRNGACYCDKKIRFDHNRSMFYQCEES